MSTRSKASANGKGGKSNGDQPTLEAISNLERKFDQSFAELKSILRDFEQKQNILIEENARQKQLIAELEQAGKERDTKLHSLEKTLNTTKRTLEKQQQRIIDLEGRSRRKNLRIINFPENTETGNPTEFFSNLLVEIFGPEMFPVQPILDRAHRALRSKPAPDQKPRPVILRFHYVSIKEQLIRAARKRGMIQFKQWKFRIVEDYAPEVMKERMTYKPIMARLYQSNYHPALLFPAKLRIILPDKTHRWFKSIAEAEKFLSD